MCVVHDHALDNLSAYCDRTLYVSADGNIYQAERAIDVRMDKFQIKRSDIREVKKNKMPLGQNGHFFEGFHIRLSNGLNLNMAHLDNQGNGLSADDVLMELMR